MAQATQRLREQAGEFATEIKEGVVNAAEATSEGVTELAGVAKERIQDWGGQAASAVQETAEQVKHQTAATVRLAAAKVSDLGHLGAHPDGGAAAHTSVRNRDSRDISCSDFASLAVFAALGIAGQKRLSASKND